MDKISASVVGLNFVSDELFPQKSDILTSKILFDGGQTHKWRHTDSCFKRSARLKPKEVGNTCRFLRPHKTQPVATHMEMDSHKITCRIPHGCEYLNGYNEVLTTTFKNNHDIQLILTSGPEVVYYALKYSTKFQQSVYDTQTAMIQALDKRIAREDPTDDKSYRARATGRYMSCCLV